MNTQELDDIITRIELIAKEDANVLRDKGGSYGDSWRKYGGVSAFMNLARKWDRLIHEAERHSYDVFAAAEVDTRDETILEDIRDLRRYLFLVEERITTLAMKKVDCTDHD